MKDGDIYGMMAHTNKRVTAIYKQMVFIDTRLQAFERVMKEPFFGVKGMFTPQNVLKRVDNIQLELMKQHDEDMRRVVEEVKEERKKPHLTLIKPNGVSLV